jgi:hypothetical protein
MPSPISPELQSKIAVWRQKAAEGTMTLEELTAAVAFLRSDRKSALVASSAKRTAKAKKAIPDASELLKDLGI